MNAKKQPNPGSVKALEQGRVKDSAVTESQVKNAVKKVITRPAPPPPASKKAVKELPPSRNKIARGLAAAEAFADKIKAAPPLAAAVPRLGVEGRTADILTHAMKVAATSGLMGLTRDQVAKAANVSGPLITRYFGGADGLREAVVTRAIEENNARILAEALIYKVKSVTARKSKIKDLVIKYMFA